MCRDKYKKTSLKTGFTLIEIIIAIGIFVSVVTIISLFALDLTKNELFFSDSINSEVEPRQAYPFISSTIRSMASSVNGSYPISSVSSSSFVFFSDTDGDGRTEQVRYFMDGGIFKRGIIKASGEPLSYNQSDEKITELVHYVISNNIFSYFGADYEGGQAPLPYPTDMSSIRIVKLELSIDKNTNLLPGKVTLPLYINIRNLRGI